MKIIIQYENDNKEEREASEVENWIRDGEFDSPIEIRLEQLPD